MANFNGLGGIRMVSENFENFFLTFLGLGTNVVKVSSVNSELLFQWDTLQLLHKAKEVEARTPTKIDDSECGTLAYIEIALTLLSMATVILLHYRKSKFCRGHRFSNVVKLVLFISDVQHYIPIRLCKTSEVFTHSKSQPHWHQKVSS